jgi:hypothetical protein
VDVIRRVAQANQLAAARRFHGVAMWPGISAATSEAAERRTAAVAVDRSGFLRQLRLPCVPRCQVEKAFFHFASITVCLPAFFPNPVDLVVVAAQINGRVVNREETNREYRDADRPHARLPPEIRRRHLKPSETQARTIGY